ncbi:GNAT family N-acetyltransferase [Domibacillus sp. A3M-37]|uniref:GNAT family N-acetyltransferase n=1 Tax=Domibacillus sp. A3M-37 TaxID=2962037 RepID=UPI0020B8BD12|nr:GNAT family N-acetyltransferase [Domibacillus sp. A3M-37]MCP3760882.1 GNAT family N-acetyltransferase [Domibacillus sp. A3M-37]
MTIQYCFDTGITAEKLSKVFQSSGIRRPADDLPRLQKMIDHADLIAEAWKEDELIGVARVVTDFSYCAYISDLAVKKEMQGLGIGAALLERVKGTLGDEVTLVLLSAPNAMDFYPKQGYEKADNAFRIMRKK